MLSAKTQQREGQAHHETPCHATFPIKLNSVQNGHSQMLLKHKADKDALKKACQEVPFCWFGGFETGFHLTQAGLKLALWPRLDLSS